MVSKKDNRLLLFVIPLFLSLSLNVSSLSSNKNFKNLLLGYSLAWQHNAATHIFCFKKSLIFFIWSWGLGLGLGLGSVGGGVVRVTLVSLTYNNKKMTATTAIFITQGCLSWVLLKSNWIYLRLIKSVDVNQAADRGSILCA